MVRALVIIALLAGWFLPLIIAALYKLPHQGPLAVLSLLLGWTGVGWLAALVIAVGGAIRATRPALAGQGPTQGPGPAQSDAPGESHARAQPAWPIASATQAPFPAAAPSPERARSPEPGQPPAPSAWPDAPHWPDRPH